MEKNLKKSSEIGSSPIASNRGWNKWNVQRNAQHLDQQNYSQTIASVIMTEIVLMENQGWIEMKWICCLCGTTNYDIKICGKCGQRFNEDFDKVI